MLRKTLGATAALALMTGMAVAQLADEVNWTLDEFLEAFPTATAMTFDEIGSNNDGIIDTTEYEAAVEAGVIEPVEYEG